MWRDGAYNNRAGMLLLVTNVLATAIIEVTAPVISSKSQLNAAIGSAQWILDPVRVDPDRLSFWECCMFLEIDTDTARERVARVVHLQGRCLHRLASKPIQSMCYRERVAGRSARKRYD